ncbi:MAG: hypothetical protein Q9191_001831 [Dirinaria sp. TL-2023a]
MAPNAAILAWYAEQAQAAAQGLRGRENQVIKAPRVARSAEQRFITQHYRLYNYADPNPGPFNPAKYTFHSMYDRYTLASDRNIQQGARLPARQGVRLDDYSCYLAARDTDFAALHLQFGSEFDHNKDIRATRIPLG